MLLFNIDVLANRFQSYNFYIENMYWNLFNLKTCSSTSKEYIKINILELSENVPLIQQSLLCYVAGNLVARTVSEQSL